MLALVGLLQDAAKRMVLFIALSLVPWSIATPKGKFSSLYQLYNTSYICYRQNRDPTRGGNTLQSLAEQAELFDWMAQRHPALVNDIESALLPAEERLIPFTLRMLAKAVRSFTCCSDSSI